MVFNDGVREQSNRKREQEKALLFFSCLLLIALGIACVVFVVHLSHGTSHHAWTAWHRGERKSMLHSYYYTRLFHSFIKINKQSYLTGMRKMSILRRGEQPSKDNNDQREE